MLLCHNRNLGVFWQLLRTKCGGAQSGGSGSWMFCKSYAEHCHGTTSRGLPLLSLPGQGWSPLLMVCSLGFILKEFLSDLVDMGQDMESGRELMTNGAPGAHWLGCHNCGFFLGTG